jgi:hypothetical protein
MANVRWCATYPLAEVKRLIRAGSCRVTGQAEVDARDQLGLLRAEVLQWVLKLKEIEFYKSMESEKLPGLWQDVYRPIIATPLHQAGVEVYCKVQVSTGSTVVISFKVR